MYNGVGCRVGVRGVGFAGRRCRVGVMGCKMELGIEWC